MKESITVAVTVAAPIEKVWETWNEPEHITGWAFASDDWECPRAENDIREGGRFVTQMQAKDGSAGFDFGGVYTTVVPFENIAYTMDDGREVCVYFKVIDGGVTITEMFEPETENTHELQRSGWQSILDNYKKYTESL